MHIAFINPQGNFDKFDSFLTEHPDFGGQLVYVKEICRALSDLGVQVDILTRKIDDPKWPGFESQIDHFSKEDNNLRIVRIKCGGSYFLNKEALWPHLPEFVDNVMRFYGSDLPNFFTAHYADAGYCAALLKNKSGRGYTFTGHSLGAQKLDKLITKPKDIDRIENQFHFSKRIDAERVSMQHACKIITSTRQEQLEQYSHPLYKGAVDTKDDDNFEIIPPGVNSKIFCSVQQRADQVVFDKISASLPQQNKPYIVSSSRLDHKKNIISLVKAYAISKELQDIARLAIFIRGVSNPLADVSTLTQNEQKVLRPILDVIKQNSLENIVDFIDMRSQAELAAAYRYFAARHSVFALTALYEPFGLAPIEAAACGLAVVATKNGGPSEIFQDSSGVLVDPLDTEDIARGCILALMNAPTFASKAEMLVSEKYTWAQTAKRYLSVIEECAVTKHSKLIDTHYTLNAHGRIKKYLISH